MATCPILDCDRPATVPGLDRQGSACAYYRTARCEEHAYARRTSFLPKPYDLALARKYRIGA